MKNNILGKSITYPLQYLSRASISAKLNSKELSLSFSLDNTNDIIIADRIESFLYWNTIGNAHDIIKSNIIPNIL
jgi:hypothetical protein